MNVPRGSRERMFGLILLVAGAVVVVMLFLRREPVPSVVLLEANTGVTAKSSALDKWVPMSWAWYWRTKDFILGRPKTVVIEAAFVSVPPDVRVMSAFPEPVKNVTNLHIYIARTNEAASMQRQLTASKSYSMSCRITTGHGIGARLMSASGKSTSPSFSLELLAKRRKDGTDLWTCFAATGFGDTVTGAITNLAMGARVQIPKDHALFIIKAAECPEETATMGVILTPTWK